MEISNCGYNYRHPSDFRIHRPNGSGDNLLLIVRSPAFFVFEGQTCYTKGNAVVVFKKGTPQIYGPLDCEYVNDWVHFDADEEEAYFDSLDIPLDTIIQFQSVSEMTKLIRYMCFEKYSNNRHFSQSTALYFHLLLLKISDLCALRTQNRIPHSALSHKLTALRNEIYTDPQKARNLNDIAKELSISVSYLQHQYKRLFQNGIKRDITASRMEYSKYLLFNTDYTIAAISRLCGYENDVHFMRVFKQENGCTPTQYRDKRRFSQPAPYDHHV